MQLNRKFAGLLLAALILGSGFYGLPAFSADGANKSSADSSGEARSTDKASPDDATSDSKSSATESTGTAKSSSTGSSEGAPSQAKLKLLEQLCDVTGIEGVTVEALTMTFEAMLKPLKDELAHADIDDAIKAQRMKDIDSFPSEVMKKLNAGPSIKQITIRSFDKYYSEDDIKALCDFYSTNAGRDALHRLPKLLVQALDSTNQVILPKAFLAYMEVVTEAESKGILPPEKK